MTSCCFFIEFISWLDTPVQEVRESPINEVQYKWSLTRAVATYLIIYSQIETWPLVIFRLASSRHSRSISRNPIEFKQLSLIIISCVYVCDKYRVICIVSGKISSLDWNSSLERASLHRRNRDAFCKLFKLMTNLNGEDKTYLFHSLRFVFEFILREFAHNYRNTWTLDLWTVLWAFFRYVVLINIFELFYDLTFKNIFYQ